VLIVVGTSLLVYPVAALVDMVPPRTPRVLINDTRGGSFGDHIEYEDYVLEGDISRPYKS
jgi:NAD-dependent SIR2 family protein deacetylase